MKCNCIKENEIRVKEQLAEKNEDYRDMIITEANFQNVSFMFNGGVETYSPMKIEYDQKNYKGEMKHKKKIINMSHGYCPFCGIKYGED
jgi:hypothetical protein